MSNSNFKDFFCRSLTEYYGMLNFVKRIFYMRAFAFRETPTPVDAHDGGTEEIDFNETSFIQFGAAA